MTTALTLPQRAAAALGTDKNEIQLRELVLNSIAIVHIKNSDARAECHSAYMTLKNARVNIEKTGKDARDDATKFSKAVIAEEGRLVAIISAEETRLQGLRDKWDADREAERQVRIEAERQRVAGIRDRIEAVRALPLHAAGKSSGAISQMIFQLAGTPDLASFEEFADEYKVVRFDVLDQLAKAETAQRDAEAEAARIIAEREELARLRAEAAERRTVQEAELKAARDKQEIELAAQRADAERIRKLEDEARAFKLQQEREALEAQNTAMRLERAILERQQAELAEAKRQQEAEAERSRLQLAAEQALADARNPVVTILDNDVPVKLIPAPAWPFPTKACTRPSDEQIITCIAETFTVTDLVAVDWLRAIDLDSLRVQMLERSTATA